LRRHGTNPLGMKIRKPLKAKSVKVISEETRNKSTGDENIKPLR
jgi:hypothetical protein